MANSLTRRTYELVLPHVLSQLGANLLASAQILALVWVAHCRPESIPLHCLVRSLKCQSAGNRQPVIILAHISKWGTMAASLHPSAFSCTCEMIAQLVQLAYRLPLHRQPMVEILPGGTSGRTPHDSLIVAASRKASPSAVAQSRRGEHVIPKVVIVGAGFGGLAAAKALSKAPAEITLIDRTNHHLFQPLVYQVATSVLAPSQMAVVGKGFAVLQSGKIQTSGFGAFLIWAFVHLQFLATSGLRLSVFLQWIWTYVTGQRGSQLIVNHHAAAPGGAEVSDAVRGAA